MTIADNGGFDVLLEISPTLATRMISQIPAIIVQKPLSTIITIQGIPVTISGTSDVQIKPRAVQFKQGIAGSGKAELSFDLLNSKISVSSVQPAVFGDLSGDIDLQTSGRGIVLECDVKPDNLNVILEVGTNSQSMVLVELDDSKIIDSPNILLALAKIYMSLGEAAMRTVRSAILSSLKDAIRDAIISELALNPVRQILFSAPASFIAPSAPFSTPSTVSPVAVMTARTLLIGIQLTQMAGNFSLVTRSAIRPSTVVGTDIDGLAIVVSNLCLVRHLIGPAVGNSLGLTLAGMVSGDPFLWTGSVPLALRGAGAAGLPPIALNSVAVFVDGAGNLAMSAGFSSSALAGGIVLNASVTVSIRPNVSIVGGRLVFAFTPNRPVVNSARVDIEAWVYLLVIANPLLGPVVAAILGLADILADGLISAPIESVMMAALTSGPFPSSLSIPLPSGIPALNVTGQSLMQGDAPQRVITIAGLTFPAPGRDHDLILTMAS